MIALSLMLSLLACDEAAQPVTPEPEPTPEPAPPAPPAPGRVAGTVQAGPFTVTPVYHGTAVVQVNGKTFWLDPWSKGSLEGPPKADVLLITDLHPDHLDEAAIAAVTTEATEVVAPAAVAQTRKEGGHEVQHVLANGASVEVAGVTITAVPMYNLTRGPEGGGVFHDKGRGNGYILEASGTRLYFAGDTECTDEMKALQGIDVAFLPMNLPYTMTPEEAAGCVAAFKPKRAIPYHYAGSDLAAFSAGLAATPEVTVETAEFYPGGLPW